MGHASFPPGHAQEHPDQGHHEGAVHPQPGGVLVPDPAGLPADPARDHLPVPGGGWLLRIVDRPQPHRKRPVGWSFLKSGAALV